MEVKTGEDSLDSITKSSDSGKNSSARGNKKNVVETRASSKKTNSGQLCQLPTNNVIRQGPDFQIVDLTSIKIESVKNEEDYLEPEYCVWEPTKLLSDEQIMKYCRAGAAMGINMDQALFILYKSNYDIGLAKKHMKTFPIYEDQFSEDDMYTFRNALVCYGKNFSKLRQMIPHKSVCALVQHYYNTKKTQRFKSIMETCSAANHEYGMQESASDDESNSNDKKNPNVENVCGNCNHEVSKVYQINDMELCYTCKLYFQATNQNRPCLPVDRERRIICPPEMKKVAEDFYEMAQPVASNNNDFQDLDDSGDVQIEQPKLTKCKLLLKETIAEIEKVRSNSIRFENSIREELRKLEVANNGELAIARDFLSRTAVPNGKHKSSAVTPSWNEYESVAAFHSLICHNADFQIVAEILQTKSISHIKTFYQEHKEDIDAAIKQRKLKNTSEVSDFEEMVNQYSAKISSKKEIIDID